MVYQLDETGLQLRSHSTLWLHGAVFRFDATKVKGIVIRDNLLRGDNRRILIEGDNRGQVIERGNSE
jgi:hypothetical protein